MVICFSMIESIHLSPTNCHSRLHENDFHHEKTSVKQAKQQSLEGKQILSSFSLESWVVIDHWVMRLMFVPSFYESLEDSMIARRYTIDCLHGVSANVVIMGLVLFIRGVSLLVLADDSPSGFDLKTLDLFCEESPVVFDEVVLLFNLLIVWVSLERLLNAKKTWRLRMIV